MALNIEHILVDYDASTRSDARRVPVGLELVEPRYIAQTRLSWDGEHFISLPALHSTRGAFTLMDVHMPPILEAMARASDTARAFEIYMQGQSVGSDVMDRLPRGAWGESFLDVENGNMTFHHRGQAWPLEQSAAPSGSVTLAVLRRANRAPTSPDPDRFAHLTHELVRLGLLSPPVGRVALGDFLRDEPFCRRYGRSRGTIIDRYYLGKFVNTIQHLVRGRTIEVGTSLVTEDNRLVHGFPNATEYRTVDIISGPGVDVSGDLNDPRLFEPASVDSILCFNVLEHCADAQRVVDNMFLWLSEGGRAFCMVPSVQRVHQAPRDYWRPLPDGLRHLFQGFAESRLYVYGNLLATLAALSALSMEDLPPQALETQHPDYPVASCIVATK